MSSAAPARSPARTRLSAWLAEELRPRQAVSSVSAAILLYLLEVILTLSLAALIFSGSLAPQLPAALSFVLVGDAVLVAVIALLSSYGGSIAVSQDAPALIVALAAASVASALPPASSQLFPTVVALIITTTLMMGAVALALGVFKLGGLVRFIPYPVMGGFLAGTGWLLAVGGIRVATDMPFGMELLEPAMPMRWLPTLALGLLMLLAVKRWRGPIALVGLFLAAFAAFYALAWLRGIPVAALVADGWLIGPFPRDMAWRLPLDAQSLGQVNWPVLMSALPIAIPALIISLAALLLNASSLELVVKQDIALNRELTAAGTANLLAGLAGGLMGYHAISFSTLNHTLTGGRRLPGLLVAAFLALTVVAGAALLAYIPRLLLGSLLVYIGAALLYEWVVEARRTFPKIDYAIIVSILVVVAVKDFMWGLALGLILTAVLFIVNYSRISSVRYELSGVTSRSRVSRGPREAEVLQAYGRRLLIFKLQGFIFFGTANQLVERVHESVHRKASEEIAYILLDFEQVTGLDSTALLSFQKLLQYTRENGMTLILTGLIGRSRDQLLKGGFSDETVGVRLFVDADHGIEWVEEQMLADHRAELSATSTLADQLAVILPNRPGLEELMRSMTCCKVAAGEYLMRQGEAAEEVYLIESGQFTVQIERAEDHPIRLETVQGGRIVGELGFFLGTPRNASVVADRDSVIYSLDRAQWEALQRDKPEVARTLNELTIRLLGQRVLHQTRVVQALQS